MGKMLPESRGDSCYGEILAMGRFLSGEDLASWGGQQGNPPVEPRWPAEPRGPQMTRMTLVITPNTSSRPVPTPPT